MRTDEFFDALGEIDEKLIINAKNTAEKPVKMSIERVSWKPFATAAACLVVVAAAVVFFANIGKISEFVKDRRGTSEATSGETGKIFSEYPESAKYQYTGDFSELELHEYAQVDREAYWSFDLLVQNSDLIVVGTFVDDARQSTPLVMETDNEYGLDYIADRGASYNKLKIEAVYKGDIGVGSEIVIRDGYFVNDGKLMYNDSSTLTPMIKGEKWVYFLRKQSPEYRDYYQPLFAEGRYPVPGNENTFVLTGSNHGVYDERYFHENCYSDVKIMLGYVQGVEEIKSDEFIMPEFPGDTFIINRNLYVSSGTDKAAESANMLFYSLGGVDLGGIQKTYLADLNGDGKREIVCECWNGLSGLSASYISAYDYANSERYVIQGEFLASYELKIKESVLYVVDYSSGSHTEAVSEKRLTLDMMNNKGKTNVDTLLYKNKSYDIVSSAVVENGVTMSVGLTRYEYQTGSDVEVLAVVENKTDKVIGLLTGCQGEDSHSEVQVLLERDGIFLHDADTYGKGFDSALGSYIIQPGETYYQVMRFDTNAEKYELEKALMPLCVPIGEYKGTATITILEDPSNKVGKSTDYTLEFEVSITQGQIFSGDSAKKFTMSEFPDTYFICNERYLYSEDSEGYNSINLYNMGGMDNVYLIDLNGDGKREICWSVNYGHSITDWRIMAYDFANKKLYELSDRGNYDYRVEIGGEEGDRFLIAVKSVDQWTDPISSDRLTLGIMTEVEEPTSRIVAKKDGVAALARSSLDIMQKLDFVMPEYPGREYYSTQHEVGVRYEDGTKATLFSVDGWIEELFLADINNDATREIVVICNGGSVDEEYSILVYNCVSKKLFNMTRNPYFSLMENDDGKLAINDNTGEQPLTFDILTLVKN